ncbi:MAG: GspE/PulE family protein [Thermodesulfobacteriota bacterium]
MDEEVYDRHTSLKLGELLLKEGFIKKKDVREALRIQQEEAEEARLTEEAYMIRKRFIGEQQLIDLNDHPERGNMPISRLAYTLNLISKKQLDEINSRERSQRSMGEILCAMGRITTHDLNYILQKYSKQLKFGEILLRHDLIDETKLNLVLREQHQQPDPLGKILVQKNLITVEQLYQTLSKQYNIPFRKLEGFVIYDNQIDKLTDIISCKYAKRNQVLPLSLHGDTLTIAVFDHVRIPILHELGRVYTHLKIKCVFITEEKFEELFEHLYGKAINRSLKEEDRRKQASVLDTIDIDLDIKSGDLYGLSSLEAEDVVNFIIKYGIIHRASDIHIEQNRHRPHIRYRIDGVLRSLKLPWLDDRLQDNIGAVVSRIKVIANLDIAERRLPQDGVFRINYFDREKKQAFDLDFRVAICPAIIGENVTMRILDSRKADVGLANLQHSAEVLEPFKALLKSSAGVVLVSGPTGSGKTSTLYGALKHISCTGIKIVTAEEPIEYSFPDIMQTQINPKIGLTYAKILRSFLRFDPDVIMLGEMRDKETADIGFDAALTGHLLLSAIHTNDAAGVISRLLELEIDRSRIAASLKGALAQRLVRRTCPNCRRQVNPPKEEWSILFKHYPEQLVFQEGDGCAECNFSGYKGRTVISELFVMNREISMALNLDAEVGEIRQMARQYGMRTMVDDGITKLDQTTLSEIIRVVPHELMREFRDRK